MLFSKNLLLAAVGVDFAVVGVFDMSTMNKMITFATVNL
jgi:hypothetical protein